MFTDKINHIHAENIILYIMLENTYTDTVLSTVNKLNNIPVISCNHNNI